jgi:hypothetical protein
MKVEELIGSRVWIKIDRFRSVPGKIESMSNAVNLDDIKSSVSQSRFRIGSLNWSTPRVHLDCSLWPAAEKPKLPAP